MNISEKLIEIAENVQKVYDAGIKKGATLDYSTGYENGKNAEYDKFWDDYQENGKRRDYHYAFASIGWTAENFYPKYDITPYQLVNTFARSRMEIDLAQRLEDCGVKFNFENIGPTPQYGFYDMYFTRLPHLDFSRCTNLSDTISTCPKLTKIDKLTLDQNTTNYTRFLRDCPVLTDVIISGTINGSGINLSASTQLSYDSIMSFINALSKTSSGKSITFSQAAINKAFETADGLNDGSTSGEWTDIVSNTVSNWTISLI